VRAIPFGCLIAAILLQLFQVRFPMAQVPIPIHGREKLQSAQATVDHQHHHSHAHTHGHSHTHGAIDPSIATSERGLWAVKWSLVGLMLTAAMQAGVFWLSGSVALLADLIHNIGDAMTALPLGIAFLVARRSPTRRFAYGFGRLEDLAGVAIVGIVLLSAVITAYESFQRFLHPQPLHHLGALAMAGLVGFIGNEVVALFRMRVGRDINSAALIADGQHAMADGLVSLSVVLSAVGVWLGFPWADPVIGMVITGVLLKIVWESGQTIFGRMLDGVEDEVIDTLSHAIDHVADVKAVEHIRARWLGHRLWSEVSVAVEPTLSVTEGAAIAAQLKATLQDHLPYLAEVIVQIRPYEQTEG
jgi:cation diffusion facilitator family transporter